MYSFFYLSKVNLGEKVVHWTLTLSLETPEVVMSQCTPPTLFSLLLSCPYLSLALLIMNKKMKNTGEPMPNFFLGSDLSFLGGCFFSGGGAEMIFMQLVCRGLWKGVGDKNGNRKVLL